MKAQRGTKPPTLADIRKWPATVGVTEAAPALGVSPSHLRALVARGEAPVQVLRMGRRYCVITASLVRLLSGETEAA